MKKKILKIKIQLFANTVCSQKYGRLFTCLNKTGSILEIWAKGPIVKKSKLKIKYADIKGEYSFSKKKW